jgi:hypothetical protein
MKKSDVNLAEPLPYSDVELEFDFSNVSSKAYKYKAESNENDLQRTKAWKQDRNGNITASVCKGLMSCGQSGGRISWNEKDKIYKFGAGVLKFVYEKAMQRKTGRFIDTELNKKEVRYGTKVEPLILKAAKEKLSKHAFNIEEVGYKAFEQVPHAGASSDSIATINGKAVATIEMKACTNWGTHYERVFNPMSDKNMDFWQTQAQMLAWKVDKAFYIVAEPPQELEKYLYCENILEMYDEWIAECGITIQEVSASAVHQEALLERIRIVNEVSDRWLESDCELDLNVTLYEIIDEFKKNHFDAENSKNLTPEVTLEAKKLKRKKSEKSKKKKTGVPKMKNPPPPPPKPKKVKKINNDVPF